MWRHPGKCSFGCAWFPLPPPPCFFFFFVVVVVVDYFGRWEWLLPSCGYGAIALQPTPRAEARLGPTGTTHPSQVFLLPSLAASEKLFKLNSFDSLGETFVHPAVMRLKAATVVNEEMASG